MKISDEALGIIGVASSRVSDRMTSGTIEPFGAPIRNFSIPSTVQKHSTNSKSPFLPERHQRHLQLITNSNNSQGQRFLDDIQNRDDLQTVIDLFDPSNTAEATTCDSSFLTCILSPTCRSCFNTLSENDVDWTNVVPETPCDDILGFLVASGHCSNVREAGLDEVDTFCSAFDACVVWDEEEEEEYYDGGYNSPAGGAAGGGDVPTSNNAEFMDCSLLTECKWEGMHEHFLGDGVCHDAMPGCYNSKVCNYDGGDCCQDTCVYPGQSSASTTSEGDFYGDCGMEGYACRDPNSANCQPILARMYQEFCTHATEGGPDNSNYNNADEEEKALPVCTSSQSLYRLIQYDSWGDGWDNTILTLHERVSANSPDTTPIYQGGLEYGSQGTIHLCLTKNEPKCYHISVENGVWGNEISWELRPLAGGAPVLAAGGSPSDCTVPLGGSLTAMTDCPNTCDSTRPDTSIQDPNYKSYKDMEACIEKKCLIQVGSCAQDESCSDCMTEDTPDFCFANENFNALIDCSMCSCTENRPAFCDAKSSSAASSSSAAAATGSTAETHGGSFAPGDSATAGSATGGTAVCGPEQTMKGTNSLMKFAECADIDQMMAMVTEFDNDHFGMLDLFEDCARTYDTQPLHGGKDALDCMKILHNIIIEEKEGEDTQYNTKGANGEVLPEKVAIAISTLANHLYTDAESFCECSAAINKETPTCSSFVNFKTLLYEAVDACKSLDAIDCAAWEEFYTPCKENLIGMYSTINFDNPEQCTYVENMCGGAGPFPAFRRLDCGGEIPKPAWDFHTLYSRGCLKSGTPQSPQTPVAPVRPLPPPPAPTPAVKPAFKPASHTTPAVPSTPKKQYVPYSNKESDEKKPYYSPTSEDYDSDSESKSYTTEKAKSHHFFRNTFIFFGVICIAGYAYHKRRQETFNYLRFRQMRQNRNYGGGVPLSGGEYSGVSLADSCSFEPPTLPPTPSDTTMI